MRFLDVLLSVYSLCPDYELGTSDWVLFIFLKYFSRIFQINHWSDVWPYVTMRIANVDMIVRVMQSVIFCVPFSLTNVFNRVRAFLNALVAVLMIVKMQYALVPIQMKIPIIWFVLNGSKQFTKNVLRDALVVMFTVCQFVATIITVWSANARVRWEISKKKVI